jgi:hypothetical protein
MTAIEDIRLKLSRGEEHLDAVSADVQNYVENSSPTFRAQHNPIDDSMTAVIENVPEVRRESGVVPGDFLHNTCSVLDHLVCALVTRSAGTVGRSHQFLIFSSTEEWQQQVTNPPPAKSWLGFVYPSHTAVIESLQPFHPGTGAPVVGTQHH